MLFNNLKFLVLPNDETASSQTICKTIVAKGGKIVGNKEDIDSSTVVIIRNAFIDTSVNKILNKEIFIKEFNLEYDAVIPLIEEKRLKCLSVSNVSDFIKKAQVDLTMFPTMTELLGVVQLSDNSSHVSSETTSTSSSTDSTDTSDHLMTNDFLISKPSLRNVQNVLLEHDKEQPKTREGSDDNKSNDVLIEAMDNLYTKYKSEGDTFRARSYKLAKTSIENSGFKIKSGSDAQRKLKHIGASIAKKIQLILDKGELTGLDESLQSSKQLNYFMHCHGVGSRLARRWNMMNIKDFKGVINTVPPDMVNEWSSLFGWAYYEDWGKKIPRAECEEHLKIVRKVLDKVAPECQVELLGSYARGKEVCGDIDLMFYKKHCNDTKEIGRIMGELAVELLQNGYIKCALQMNSQLETYVGPIIRKLLEKCQLTASKAVKRRWEDDHVIKKYFFGVKLPQNIYKKYYDSTLNKQYEPLKKEDQFMSASADDNLQEPICRRLDFFCCQWSELGAARIHYIGSDEFNRWIRLRAISMGLSLTQHGLFKGDRLLESMDEGKIFEYLNLQYVEIKDRTEGQWDRLGLT